jgi:hypothetical protein
MVLVQFERRLDQRKVFCARCHSEQSETAAGRLSFNGKSGSHSGQTVAANDSGVSSDSAHFVQGDKSLLGCSNYGNCLL